MENKVAKPVTVKPRASRSRIVKPLKEQLSMAVHKVLSDSELDLTDKVEKRLKKTVSLLVKKTAKQVEKALKTN